MSRGPGGSVCRWILLQEGRLEMIYGELVHLRSPFDNKERATIGVCEESSAGIVPDEAVPAVFRPPGSAR